MAFSVKRFQAKIKTRIFLYLRCGAKTVTFIFWASLYFIVMRMTIFKGNVDTPIKDWAMEPDNYTKWLGSVLGEDEPDTVNNVDWMEPDNATIYELGKRAKVVQDVCRKRSISQTINNKEFFVDYAHSLVWCNIFKAASSSWMYKFNILAGYDKKYLSRTRHAPLMLARTKFPRPSEDEVRDTMSTPGVISLLVVREPFVRLVSAYRDKLENITPRYYRKLARLIITEYREKATNIFGPITSFGPTFYEFVSYLIHKHKVQGNVMEFDEHWAPYYQFCTPCAVNFTVIAKVETLTRDSAFVIQQLGISHLLGPKVSNRRTRLRTIMNKSRDGRNTKGLLKHYFSQLDEQMLNDLLQIYGLDFEMFGYDATLYKSYIRK